MRKVLGFLIAAALACCLTTGVAFARGGDGGGHGAGGGHGFGGYGGHGYGYGYGGHGYGGYGAFYGYSNGYYPQINYPYYSGNLRAWSYYGNPNR